MDLRESVSFVVDVFVVVCLGLVYVAGLTAGTVLAIAVRAGWSLWPTAGGDRTRGASRQ